MAIANARTPCTKGKGRNAQESPMRSHDFQPVCGRLCRANYGCRIAQDPLSAFIAARARIRRDATARSPAATAKAISPAKACCATRTANRWKCAHPPVRKFSASDRASITCSGAQTAIGAIAAPMTPISRSPDRAPAATRHFSKRRTNKKGRVEPGLFSLFSDYQAAADLLCVRIRRPSRMMPSSIISSLAQE